MPGDERRLEVLETARQRVGSTARRATIFALPLTLMACLKSGLPRCSEDSKVQVDYVLVEYRAAEEANTAPRVEINATASYQSKRAALRSAAIRMPDKCRVDTAQQAAGISTSSESILSTTCGTYLKEIESALAGAGFKVFSWDALVQLQNTKHISTYAAAQELGAEVVFVFNSLDVGPVNSSGQSKAHTRYFKSNAKGDTGEPLAMAEDDPVRTKMKQFVRDHVPTVDASHPSVLGCTLDATAIYISPDHDTQTKAGTSGMPGSPTPPASPSTTAIASGAAGGESIWFYRRTETRPLREAGGRAFLFAGVNRSYHPTIPEGLGSAPKAEARVSAEDLESSSQQALPQDAYQAEKLELMRGAAHDFVESFRTGKGAK